MPPERRIELGAGQLYIMVDGHKIPLGTINKGAVLVFEPEPLTLTITRCVQMDCYWNTNGICNSIDTDRKPELGDKCPVYEED